MEFFAVVGPSGCGKSTLLDVIAALAPVSSGAVTFEGQPIGDTVPDGVGVVFQENACFPWPNVADNITFGLRRQPVDKAEIERRLQYALQLMGLQDFSRAFPSQLSGGMRQRVCIARTLVMQPRLILQAQPFIVPACCAHCWSRFSPPTTLSQSTRSIRCSSSCLASVTRRKC